MELCDDDHRKLYSLLDADLDGRHGAIDARLRRLEYGMVALIVASGSQVAALLGAPNIPAGLLHLIVG